MTEISSIPRRVEWIDVAKGIGIILVILVHSIIPLVNPVTTHLSSFAIPLFFVLAGLTYNSDKHRYQLKEFAITRGRQFLIPYFGLYTIIMGLFYLLPGVVDTYVTPDQLVFWFFYGSGPPGQATHLWFLPVLYFGFMLFVVLDRVLSGFPRWSRFLLVPILPFIAYTINSMFNPLLVPWHMGAILMATTFVLLGNELRNVYGLRPWSTASKAKDA
ncbi:MAG: acyltransferase, partial [Candidatus Thorarchaeota archaeon]|nr:acyltransferase [Candidatus Thorarchaeota archaeon]